MDDNEIWKDHINILHTYCTMIKTGPAAAATANNIQAIFQCCGIWPFNPATFKKWDFAPSQLTDRPGQAFQITTSDTNQACATIAPQRLLLQLLSKLSLHPATGTAQEYHSTVTTVYLTLTRNIQPPSHMPTCSPIKDFIG